MEGTLQKMKTKLEDVVHYSMDVSGTLQSMNDLIGKRINIKWLEQVICICGKTSESFFRAGFCKSCFFNAPQASQSIFRPELCTAHLGIEERDLDWEKEFQLAKHYVYLANSSGIKVGITRESNGLVRWMDQGASQAIILAEVPNRRFSGDIEVILKNFVNDITNWRRMLSGKPEPVDLVQLKQNLSIHVPKNLQKYIVIDNTVVDINYPVLEYPKKIKSVKLDRIKNISGELRGIKGQYLILDENRVFNVRAHERYVVEFSYESISHQSLLF